MEVIKRPPCLKAIQYTGDNEAEIALAGIRLKKEWGSYDRGSAIVSTMVQINGGLVERVVFPGNWIVYEWSRVYDLLSDKTFKEQYLPTPEWMINADAPPAS